MDDCQTHIEKMAFESYQILFLGVFTFSDRSQPRLIWYSVKYTLDN